MSAKDILQNNNMNVDDLRVNRENRTNPAEFQAGQGSDLFSSDLGWADNNTENTASTNSLGTFNSVGTGTPTGLTPPMGMGQGFGMQQQQPIDKPIEDKFFDASAAVLKGTFSETRTFMTSFSGLTPRFWAKYGKYTTITGMACGAFGLLTWLLLRGNVEVKAFGSSLVVSGLLASAIGVVTLMFNRANAHNYDSYYSDMPSKGIDNGNNLTDSTSSAIDFNDSDWGSPNSDDDSSSLWENNSDGFSEDDFSDEDDEFAEEYTDEDDFEDYDDFPTTAPDPGLSTQDALNNLTEVPKGMYTRQYLYDMFTAVLPTLTPDFGREKQIDCDSSAFLVWEEYLRQAASVSGAKPEYLEDFSLMSLSENLFTIILECERIPGLKVTQLADELANIYAYADKDNPKKGVYATAVTFGNTCRVTLFTAETAMISVKDAMLVEKDFVMDVKNTIPVILGVNERGKVIKADFKNIESVLITGMPRSGKSWFVKAVITQMCAFMSPSELNFYICDPKDDISDFSNFTLPHVKKFVSGDDNIVATLRDIANNLAPKRKKIIGDAGHKNIWEYKKANPDVKMPIIYVLIDEVVTLAERMEKETKAEFQGLLIQLISQFPALGIRAFLIPHVVKNDIIAKTATDIVPCRISVMGTAEHIESSTGTKPKDFNYKLTHKGDMAVKMSEVSPDTIFVHSVVLTDSDVRNDEIFAYLRKVWGKLEPEEVTDSLAKNAEAEEFENNLLFDKDNGDVTFDLFGDSDDSGFSNINVGNVKNVEDNSSENTSFDDIFN